jgi:hypothetical protein
VITNTDTAFSTASESAVFAPSAVANSANLLNENANSEELDRTHMSYQNLTPESAAIAMVKACDSVGATMYKAAFTPIYPLVGMADELPEGEERSFPQKNGVNATSAELIARIPEFFRRNNEDNRNIAVRVWGPIFQVDDCSAEFYERLKPFCFAAIRTSPKSWQVWISLSGDFVGKDGKRNDALVAVRTRFFDRCKELKESANGGAYNSIRLPGTLNIKEKYAPEFPRIQLVYVSKGRQTTPEELDAADLLVPAPTPKLTLVNSTPRPRNILAPTPFYQDYVNRAPLKEDGKPNLNRADLSFVIRLRALGYSRAEAAAELRAVRDKAARRPDYVERTLDAADDRIARTPAPGRERVAI